MEGDRSRKRMKLSHKMRIADEEEEMEEAPALFGAHSGPGFFFKQPQVFELLRHSGDGLKSIPAGEKNNMFFIVKNTESTLKIHKGGINVFHDDNVWDRSKVSKIFSYIGNVDGIQKTIALCDGKFWDRNPPMKLLDPQPDKDSVIKVHRYYAVLKADPDYRRRITILTGGGFTGNKALVEYCGRFMKPSPEHRQNLKSLLADQRMTGKIKRNKSRSPTVHRNITLPKESFQVHNVENVTPQKTLKKLGSTVPYEKQVILTMLSENPSVQAVINRKDKSQCVILYSQEQLSDMKTNLECENVLGVDCTLKFGDCYVTMTVYQNFRALHRDTNEPLLFLGPVYLHRDQECLTYSTFFSHLMDKLEGVELNIEVKLGNDVGLPLFKALKCCFPTSSHILDCHHLKKTVNRELFDVCDGKVKECSIISKKMFGLGGLTSSPTLFSFRKRLSDLEPYFDEFPRLRAYFMKMSVILYEYLCEPQRKGVSPKLWAGRRDEILTSFIQSVLRLESYELPVLVKKLCIISGLQMQYIKDWCD